MQEVGTGGGSRVENLTEKIEAIRNKRDRLSSLLVQLERTGESQVSLTDPDSRAMAVVEHPFGPIKQWMYQGAFLMRGVENVRAEFGLTALVYNLRRALNILSVGPMMAAVCR